MEGKYDKGRDDNIDNTSTYDYDEKEGVAWDWLAVTDIGYLQSICFLTVLPDIYVKNQ